MDVSICIISPQWLLACRSGPDARVVCDTSPLKVLQLNYPDITAALRAAYRIHHALRYSGIHSRMLVNVSASGDWAVQGPTPIIHSPAVLPFRWPERINASDVDLVHLHWVQGEMLLIADIDRIRKPIKWTLHDMWTSAAQHPAWDNR